MAQFFSVLAVSLLLTLIGFSFWVRQGLAPIIQDLQEQHVVTAFLKPDSEVVSEDRIRLSLGASARDSRVETEVVTSEKFMRKLGERYPDLAREIEDLGEEGKTLVPRFVTVAGNLSPEAVDRVKAIDGVDSVEASRDQFRNVVGAFESLRWISTVLIVGLMLAILTGLIQISRTHTLIQHETLALMRLLGASRIALGMPAVISGLLVGALGGAIACGFWIGFGSRLTTQVKDLSPFLASFGGMPHLGALLLLAGLALGAFGGALGGWAMRKAA
jgi:cell division protein FtsX